MNENDLYATTKMISRREQFKDKIVYHVSPEYGSGKIIHYDVFEGAAITYNDLKIDTVYKDSVNPRWKEGFIEINYCLSGRFQCKFLDNTYIYMGDNEIAINCCGKNMHTSNFTFRPYKGITILIEVKTMDSIIKAIFKNTKIDLYRLLDYLNTEDKCFVIKAEDKIKNIFLELYTIEPGDQMDYMKLKTLELIMLLSNIEIFQQVECKKYYEKELIIKIKSLKTFLEDNKEKHITIEELSREFHINTTTLKESFKGIYGIPVYTYVKHYRMYEAAKLLRETNNKVADIAVMVGYLNPSKFSEAFYKVIGMKPLSYRRNK